MAMAMQERIAKRVSDLLERDYDGVIDGVEHEFLDGMALDIAAAVLAELETPTDGMLKDSENAWSWAAKKSFGECISASYAAAIRAAREGK